jgi:hypothetical protein
MAIARPAIRASGARTADCAESAAETAFATIPATGFSSGRAGPARGMNPFDGLRPGACMADNKLLVPFHFNQLGEARVSRPPADRVVEGDIVCRNGDVDRAKDGTVRAGVWESTPGVNRSIAGR